MTTAQFERAMKNPMLTFDEPGVLLSSADFSTEQKLSILLQWKDQLEQFLRADEEGMQWQGSGRGVNAERLRHIEDAITALESR